VFVRTAEAGVEENQAAEQPAAVGTAAPTDEPLVDPLLLCVVDAEGNTMPVSRMNVKELRAELVARRAPMSGNKKELSKRVQKLRLMDGTRGAASTSLQRSREDMKGSSSSKVCAVELLWRCALQALLSAVILLQDDVPTAPGSVCLPMQARTTVTLTYYKNGRLVDERRESELLEEALLHDEVEGGQEELMEAQEWDLMEEVGAACGRLSALYSTVPPCDVLYRCRLAVAAWHKCLWVHPGSAYRL
jgi:hypothetical protein